MIGWAIESVLASALLMVLVLAVRGPVRRSFGPGIAYALWVLPAARLLLPPLPAAWRDEAAAPITRASEGITVMVVEPLGLAPADALSAAAPASHMPSLALLLVGLWIAGGAAFLLWHLIAHARFCRRILAAARSVLRGPVNVVESNAASGPLAFGIWRKYVAFPGDFSERYDADERALALEHELTHHQRGDLLANWAALIVLAIHWFNPIAWRAFRAFRADQEMACDARVLAGRDAAFRHAYGRAIVKSAHGGAISPACHLHTINDLKGRLRMLSVGKKSRARVLGGAASVAVLALAALGLTASGTQAAERLRSHVTNSIGVDIATLDAAMPTVAVAPAAVGAQQATPEAAPPAPPAPPSADGSPAPVVVVDGNTDQHREWTDKDGKRHVVVIRHRTSSDTDALAVEAAADALADSNGDGKPAMVKRVIVRGQNGKTMTDDISGVDIPEITSADCPADGNDRQTVIHGTKGDKKTMVICLNRIQRLADNAAKLAANSRDIERNAYQQALTGLRHAREGADVRNIPEASKAIDEAIAELEADLAKLN